MISAVLFDLDETLLDRTHSLIGFLVDQYARFWRRLGTASVDAWCSRFVALDARGQVHKSAVYPAILSEFDGDSRIADVLLADYRERCCRHARPLPGMVDTLQTLRAQAIALGIVTNGETDFQTRHIEALELHRLVDEILISQAEQLRKPDMALFTRAAERLQVKPANCLFVGDNPVADIMGAHRAGMQTAWFSCGLPWPDDIAPLPGAAIDALVQVLGLVRGSDGASTAWRAP
jgi:putative hydrolase of the HAD superfamily